MRQVLVMFAGLYLLQGDEKHKGSNERLNQSLGFLDRRVLRKISASIVKPLEVPAKIAFE